MQQLVPPGPLAMDEHAIWDCYAWPERPGHVWLRANMVTSVDGSASLRHADASKLSTPADRRVFGLLRAGCHVVLVGAGTARDENYGPVRVAPEFASLRAASGLDSDPVLAVVTQRCDLDPRARMFTGDKPVIVLTGRDGNEHKKELLREVATVVEVGAGALDLRLAVDRLRDLALTRVLCEGGPRLLADLLAADLVDDLCATVSPMLVGDAPLRMLAGTGWSHSPIPLQLASLLEDDSTLLCRWLVGDRPTSPPRRDH